MSVLPITATADIKEACAALLDMALGKAEAETVMNDDLARIGRDALKREGT